MTAMKKQGAATELKRREMTMMLAMSWITSPKTTRAATRILSAVNFAAICDL